MKTTPRPYQLAEYERTKDRASWALWWDQGTGKSKVIIDTLAHLWRAGRVDGLVVLAPGGVEANWIYDEIPKHLDDDIPWEALLWSSKRRKTQKFRRRVQEVLDSPGLQVLAISYDGIMVDDGAKLTRRWLDDHRCLYVADEATAIKTPNAKVTKRVLASAKYAAYRRLLCGTPVEDGPFDLYAQARWVDPSVWERRGINNFSHFKGRYGMWVQCKLRKSKRSFPKLTRYQNLDDLQECLFEVGTRVRKEDVLSDLPPKTYEKIYFDLSPAQWRVYRDLADGYADLGDGKGATAELAIVQMTRRQQVTSGFVPADDEEGLVWIGDRNPRMDALATAVSTIPPSDQMIIWAKYNMEIDSVAAWLRERKISYCIYDGRVPTEDRQRAKQDYQAGKFRVFLAKTRAAGKGLTLTAASHVIYFSTYFSGDYRRQSEDRAHRIGQTRSVRYIDLVARDTVDEDIMSILRQKRERSSYLTKDPSPDWI